MKILNLYAGIGGNRKFWTPNGNDHEITAIENNPEIAKIYQDFFPNDKMIVTDAHQYLLEHYKEYDFIWSSPPCPSHSDIRRCGTHRGQNEAIYPEMSLYQEIILLDNFAPKKTKWIVENVKPYYNPLINPSISLGRHYFWLNFYINFEKQKGVNHDKIKYNDTIYGFNLNEYKIEINKKRQILRNMVNPEIGLHILNRALEITEADKYGQSKLFES